MMDDFNAMRNREPLTPESWATFMEDVLQKSVATTNKRLAGGQEDFVLIYVLKSNTLLGVSYSNRLTHVEYKCDERPWGIKRPYTCDMQACGNPRCYI